MGTHYKSLSKERVGSLKKFLQAFEAFSHVIKLKTKLDFFSITYSSL